MINLKRYIIFLLVLCSAIGYAQSFSSPTTIPANGNVTVNGVTITTVSTGDVNNGISANPQTPCLPKLSSPVLTTVPGQLRVGSSSGTPSASTAWSVTLNFSSPVNNVVFSITTVDLAENFIFKSNGGPVSLSHNSCYMNVTGNQAVTNGVSGGSVSDVTGGFFQANSPFPYTQLTINGNGGGFGSVILLSGGSIQPLAQPCTKTANIPPNGTFTVNGVTVNSASTGAVMDYWGTYSVCGSSSSITMDQYPLWVGYGTTTANSSPWQTTLTFSKPVNEIVVLLSATGSIHNEIFRFTSNNGTISIADNGSCFSTISGNTIISGQGSSSTNTGGGGVFTLSSPTPFTQLVMSGDGGDNGSMIAICEASIKESCIGTVDSDGDGKPDDCDLDDDNDGILDTAENSCNLTTSTTWSGTASPVTGTNGSGVTANNITMTSVATTGANTSFTASPNGAFNTTNFWSNSAVAGANSLQFVHTWDTTPEDTQQANVDGGTRTYTITFAKPVNKAIIHLDRLGGNYQIPPANYFSNSTEFTLTSSGISMKKLAGNNQLIVTGNKFYRSVGDDLGSVNPGGEANNTNGTAAGSIEFSSATGQLFNSLTFTVIGQGIEGAGNDGMEFIIESCIGTDTDGDGIPNHLDLDSDGDGCSDAREGAGNFTTSQLTTASGAIVTQSPNQNFGITVDANGIPTTVGASGQAIGNSQNTMVNECISFVCPPDPYAAQQTWWLPYSNTKVRIDFQSGSAVLNNPTTGFLGQGTYDGFEGNVTVTHPITGEFLFATDGNVVYKASTGSQATGSVVGGNGSSGEAAAVIPDPNGILGRNFLIIGNSASNTTGSIRMAKYDLQTNVVSGVTSILSGGINEALEVIPHTNGTDYWILVSTSDQKVKSYLYSKASGFNSTPASSTDVPDLAGVSATTIAQFSFISWDPRTAGKVLIARHNKVGLANFDPSTGALGTWDVKVTVTSGTATANSYTGYSVALSPNGRYIYYNEYVQSNNTGILKYYDIQTGVTTTLDAITAGMNGMKIAPDGKLYKLGYISGVLRLLYLNTDANTPPSSSGSLLAFDTGGRSPSLQLPNNVYWGCITCQSGTAAPALASTNITSNPATVGDLIAALSPSNQPAGTVITIHSGTPATDANKLANSTAIVPGTIYYASFYDGLAACYSPTTLVTVSQSICFNDPVLTGNGPDTKVGITLLKRAGAQNADNWPMVRKSGHIALESNTQGFVINRLSATEMAAIKTAGNAVDGMMVFDTTNKCLSIYDGTDWKCFDKAACP